MNCPDQKAAFGGREEGQKKKKKIGGWGESQGRVIVQHINFLSIVNLTIKHCKMSFPQKNSILYITINDGHANTLHLVNVYL